MQALCVDVVVVVYSSRHGRIFMRHVYMEYSCSRLALLFVPI